jgi:hypothetical protein
MMEVVASVSRRTMVNLTDANSFHNRSKTGGSEAIPFDLIVNPFSRKFVVLSYQKISDEAIAQKISFNFKRLGKMH